MTMSQDLRLEPVGVGTGPSQSKFPRGSCEAQEVHGLPESVVGDIAAASAKKLLGKDTRLCARLPRVQEKHKTIINFL